MHTVLIRIHATELNIIDAENIVQTPWVTLVAIQTGLGQNRVEIDSQLKMYSKRSRSLRLK